jgi:hypothetical protein
MKIVTCCCLILFMCASLRGRLAFTSGRTKFWVEFDLSATLLHENQISVRKQYWSSGIPNNSRSFEGTWKVSTVVQWTSCVPSKRIKFPLEYFVWGLNVWQDMHVYQSNRKQTSQKNGSAWLAYSLIRKIILKLLYEPFTFPILDFRAPDTIVLFRIFGY